MNRMFCLPGIGYHWMCMIKVSLTYPFKKHWALREYGTWHKAIQKQVLTKTLIYLNQPVELPFGRLINLCEIEKEIH